ncbi:hypothetical protein BJQ94_06220 [Cryobacterium sp. SO2]|uniref:hypothetical protein n=1 Tax=Cryobacterium sp. SO2 TaxID=1897060 RepID=UPI00223CC29D|nr:hypothetical protein [Cryobacterium sp. SO2]WEO78626.1 hypothetical protein BJQ94_06220 [Cryobacterium sp. SO2]
MTESRDQSASPPALPPELLLAADYRRAFGGDLRLRRGAERGHLHRLGWGRYTPMAVWEALDRDQRYALRVRAAALGRGGALPLSHQSAAAVWQLPLLAPWPEDVHFLTERATGGRSEPGVRKHAVGFDARDVELRDGVLVTTVARTVIDLATVVDLRSAVAAADRALAIDRSGRTMPLTDRATLLETWERMLPFRGSVRARTVIDFASPLSGSPDESGSRVSLALAGFTEPVLQHPFEVDGRTVFTDFFWLHLRGVGESDGRVKYFDPVMLNGRTPAEVVYEEKVREDAIRRQVLGFVRWDHATGLSVPRLTARLAVLGLTPGRPRLWER